MKKNMFFFILLFFYFPLAMGQPDSTPPAANNPIKPPINPDPYSENWGRILEASRNERGEFSSNLSPDFLSKIGGGVGKLLGGKWGAFKEENLLYTIFNDVAGNSQTIQLFNPNDPIFGPKTFIPGVGFGLGLSFTVRRKLFDNRRVIEDSFTVWDKFSIGINPYAAVGTNVGVSVMAGLNLQVDVDNWRQVKAGEKEETVESKIGQSIKNRYFKVKEKFLKSTKLAEPDQEPEVSKNSDTLLDNLLNLFQDSEREKIQKAVKGFSTTQKKAIFSRIWNPLTMLGRIPFRANWVNVLLGKDEVIQYTLEGGVNVMVAVSTASALQNAPLPPAVKNVVNQGIDLTAFVTGRFKVAIMRPPNQKANENFAFVKVTKESDKGVKVGFGSVTPVSIKDLIASGLDYSRNRVDNKNDVTSLEENLDKAKSIFGGFSFILDIAGGEVTTVQLPRADIQRGFGKSNSRIYLFDLNKKEGQRAYNFAVLGFLSVADKLALTTEGKPIPENVYSPVRFVMSLEEKEDYVNWMFRAQIGFLAKITYDKRNSLKDSVLTDSEGKEYKQLIAELNEKRERKVLMGVDFERREHNIKIVLDENKFKFENPAPDSAYMNFVGAHDDKHTDISELFDYAWEFEIALNIPGLIPRPPRELTTSYNKFGKASIKNRLGYFYYSYNGRYNARHIFNLVNTPFENRWPIIYKAFNGERRGWDLDFNSFESKFRQGGQKFLHGLSKISEWFGTRTDSIDAYRRARATFKLWGIINCKFGLKKDANCKPYKFKDENEKLNIFQELIGEFFDDPGYKPELLGIMREVNKAEDIPYGFGVSFPIMNYSLGHVHGSIPLDRDFQNEFQSVLLKNQKAYPNLFSTLDVSPFCWKIEKEKQTIDDCYFRISFYSSKNLPPPDRIAFQVRLAPLAGIGSVFYQEDFGVVEIPFAELLKFATVKNIGLETITFWFDGKAKNHVLYPIFKNLVPGTRFSQRHILTVVPLDKNREVIGQTSKMPFFMGTTLYKPKNFKEVIFQKVADFDSCEGKSYKEIIPFLGPRHFKICPIENKQKKISWTCNPGTGEIPYDPGNKNDLITDGNTSERDEWLKTYCPAIGEENVTLDKNMNMKICKKTARETIEALGDKPFYLCDGKTPKDENGFCTSGVLPYPDLISWNFENESNPSAKLMDKIKRRFIYARNSYIYKQCQPID